MDYVVFVIAALGCVSGAVGVVLSRNPVHAALSLVGTLFGIAVLFVAQGAHFLAAVQVIVYAGAIVVLFLFVIMLLGVDKAEQLETEPLGGAQRPAAVGVAGISLVLLALLGIRASQVSEGARSASGTLHGPSSNVATLGRSLFTDYVFAFELTSVLLVIAVVGAVVLARRPSSDELAGGEG
jgi:NADH-quinone oxidoreductase subunit J